MAYNQNAQIQGAHVQGESVQGESVQGQQHPIGLYIKVWALLFVLSTLSYLVDFFHLQGVLRWSLIVIFMLLKAGLIVSVFMHMLWERIALLYAILIPPLCLLLFLGIMAMESEYTFLARVLFFNGQEG